jgi:hypothetical protein
MTYVPSADTDTEAKMRMLLRVDRERRSTNAAGEPPSFGIGERGASGPEVFAEEQSGKIPVPDRGGSGDGSQSGSTGSPDRICAMASTSFAKGARLWRPRAKRYERPTTPAGRGRAMPV